MDSTIVIKVKHAKTLRRFNARVLNNGLELTLDGLRNKIRGLFNFSPDADLVLTYLDEDNDKITLGDDEDLLDVVRQSLNPLRISVSLRTDDVARTPSESEGVTRTPNTSASVRTLESSPVQSPAQNTFENLNSSFIEYINSLPEPFSKKVFSSLPEPLNRGFTKILSDLASTGTSHGLSEVIQLLTEKGLPFPRQPSESGAATDSSVHANAPATKNTSNLAGAQEAGSSNVQKFEPELLSKEKLEKLPSKTGVSIVISDPEAVTEAKSAPKFNGIPRNQVTETNEVVKSGGSKESDVSPPGQKAEKDAQSAQKEKAISEENASFGKATKSSPVVGAPTISHPMFSIKKKDVNMPIQVPKPIKVDDPSGKATKLPWFVSSSMPNSIPLVNSDSFKKHTEPPKPVQGFPFPAAPGFQTWNKGQPNTFNYPSSPAPQCPFLGTSIGNNPAGPYTRRSYGYSDGSGTIFHRGVRCDGCGVHPITGTRFKSVVKDDYDLCSICFAQMGVESDYMRIDRPATFHNPTPAPSPFAPRVYRSPQSSAFNSYCGNLTRPKLDSRFIQDVTILDNALMAPSTPFTKIWRMRNNGSLQWPWGTKLVWIGGDKMGDVFSVDLEIAGGIGFPVDQELDVAVDFVAPDRPGRYVSYWRMRSPTGQKFGQRVWVLIQVDGTLTAVQQALRDFNLNHMPSNTPGGSAPEVLEDAEPLEDNAADLVKPVFDLSSEKTEDMIFPINDSLLVGSTSQPPSSSASSPRVSYPMIDLSDAFPSRPSGGTATFVAPPFNDESDHQTTTELVPPAQKPATEESKAAPVAIPFPAAPELSVDAASDEQMVVQAEGEEENELEKSLLMELDRMGFKEVDLNKEILRSNKYDLEKALNDLCGESEWDPILEELHEMGFHDDVMNKKLLEKNKGSVTQVVLDLLVEEGQ